MMNRNKAKILAALCLSASAMICSSPAAAQSADVDVPTSIYLVRPLQLFVDRPLQFGPVAPSATGGTVVVAATAAGARTNPTGSVTLLPPTASMPVNSGVVRALGDLNAAVGFIIDMPTALNNAAAGTNVGYSGTDSHATPALLSTPAGAGQGSYTFYVGGTVTFAGGESGGLYQNSINVTASYN